MGRLDRKGMSCEGLDGKEELGRIGPERDELGRVGSERDELRRLRSERDELGRIGWVRKRKLRRNELGRIGSERDVLKIGLERDGLRRVG